MPLWDLSVMKSTGDVGVMKRFAPAGETRPLAREAALLAEEYHGSVTVTLRSTGQWIFTCWWEDKPRQRIRWRAENFRILEECLLRHRNWREELCVA
jgi:hypothetical protein